MPFASEGSCVSSLGLWSVPVPYRRASDIQSRLRKRGCPATVCLDPEGRSAWLEPWPDVDPSLFMAELSAATI